MSDSIFVNQKDRISITVGFARKDGKTVIAKEGNGASSLTMEFRRPSYEDSQIILHSSSFSDESGRPVIDIIRLRKAALYHLAVGWDAKDGDNPVPITPDKISEMDPVLANEMAKRLEDQLGGASLFLA